MLKYDPKLPCLPSSEELPESDDSPTDKELQIAIAHRGLKTGDRICPSILYTQ